MILTADISNSHITVAGMVDGKAAYFCQLATEKTRTADEYAVLMSLMLDQHGGSVKSLEGCILSSVVPELTMTFAAALRTLTGLTPLVVGPGVKTGLSIRLDDPSELGSDFVAAAVAAQADYPLPVVTVDMDTAVGIGVTDSDGVYIGGIIAPGVTLSTAALSKGAAMLHNVQPRAPGTIICKNTDESMRSGIIYGSAAMLDGLLMGIEEELGQEIHVVVTGIWAETVVPHCRWKNIHLDRELIHRGLWMIWKKNRKQK